MGRREGGEGSKAVETRARGDGEWRGVVVVRDEAWTRETDVQTRIFAIIRRRFDKTSGFWPPWDLRGGVFQQGGDHHARRRDGGVSKMRGVCLRIRIRARKSCSYLTRSARRRRLASPPSEDYPGSGKCRTDNEIQPKSLLNNNKSQRVLCTLTSFDWNETKLQRRDVLD